jgi:hypothetical protein
MLASPPPHTASTRRSVGEETAIGVVTIILLPRGETFTITGAALGVAVVAGLGAFAEAPLTVGAGGVEAGGAVAGLSGGT